MDEQCFRPLDFGNLRARLLEVKSLLEQAAAVGLVKDAEKLEALVRKMKDNQEQISRAADARRFR